MKCILHLLFQVFLFVPLFSQNLVSVSPSSANAGQTLNVTITGANTNFSQGSGTFIDFGFNQGSGTTVVNSIIISSNTSMLANITVPPNTYTGNYDVSVYNSIDGYLLLNNGFYVNGLTPPSLVSINPSNANAGQTLNVTITGANTNFLQGSGTLVEFGFNQGSATVNSINVVSNTSLLANVTVPSNTYSGNYDVYAYNQIDGVLSLNNGFYVNGLPPPFTISPDHADAGQTLNVTITGNNTNFSQGSGTVLGFNFYQGSGTTVVNSINIASNISMLANITVPPNTYPGDYEVYVYNSIDGYLSINNGFRVNPLSAKSFFGSDNKTIIYPNPFNDNFIVEFGIANTSSVLFSIYSNSGKEIKQLEKRVLQKGKYQEQINTEQLSGGVYFFVSNINGQIQSMKILKM